MKHIKLVLVGAGGHAKVVADIVRSLGCYELAGATDSSPKNSAARRSGLKILGSDDVLPQLLTKGVTHAAIGVGSIKDNGPRQRMREKVRALGFALPPLVHPRAVVADSVKLGNGCQVMAGAIVNPGAEIGKGSVINTGAVVEHDCKLGNDAFVGPGATLGGDVTVEDGAFIGLGAVVLPGISIGTRAVVGAGAVVRHDVPPGKTVFGVPAKLKGQA